MNYYDNNVEYKVICTIKHSSLAKYQILILSLANMQRCHANFAAAQVAGSFALLTFKQLFSIFSHFRPILTKRSTLLRMILYVDKNIEELCFRSTRGLFSFHSLCHTITLFDKPSRLRLVFKYLDKLVGIIPVVPTNLPPVNEITIRSTKTVSHISKKETKRSNVFYACNDIDLYLSGSGGFHTLLIETFRVGLWAVYIPTGAEKLGCKLG